MSQIKAAKAFAKTLAYILGVDPYEFGLIPDSQGYIKIKECLKALKEEEGWRHIREGHIKEVLLTIAPSPIEMENKKVRAVDRSRLVLPAYVAEVPGVLYTAIRQRAWPRAHDRGLEASEDTLLRLTTDKNFAKRLGHRIDGNPIILTIHVPLAESLGIVFQRAAEHLYLAHELPAKTLSGPGLPKPDEAKNRPKKKKPVPPPTPPIGGTFPGDDDLPVDPKKNTRGKKDKESWKENKKRFRKDKNHFNELA